MTPDEIASSRGHRLSKITTAGRFTVRTCKRCGLRLVVSDDNPNGFGGCLEQLCRDGFGGEAA